MCGEQVVFGSSPPLKLVPYFLVANDAMTLITRAEDNGVELNFTIPTEFMQHTGLKKVLPNAKYLMS
jgi:hypothetical protein